MKKQKKALQKNKKRPFFIRSLQQQLTVTILAVILVSSAATILVYLAVGIFAPVATLPPLLTGAIFLLACTVISTVISGIIYRQVFRPLREMIKATNEITSGNYKIRIEETSDPQSDLGTLQRSFNNMTHELDGIEMFRSDFINNFSHEFKTPIVSIRGFAHQLQSGDVTDAQRDEYISIIADESERLANMATNVLLLSKLENQKIVTDKTCFYLDEQIRACLLMLEKHWDEKNIELDIDLDEVKYTFNEDMLSHIWINLFGNAIKFTPSNGKISCSLRSDGKTATVIITDTGVGMDEETKKHVFEKFYQGDRSHSGDGNGIGLTIVHRILTLCGGDISIDSTPNMGSTFTVRLPLVG